MRRADNALDARFLPKTTALLAAAASNRENGSSGGPGRGSSSGSRPGSSGIDEPRLTALVHMVVSKIELRGNTSAEQLIRVKRVFQSFDKIGMHAYATGVVGATDCYYFIKCFGSSSSIIMHAFSSLAFILHLTSGVSGSGLLNEGELRQVMVALNVSLTDEQVRWCSQRTCVCAAFL
jgi:hypothetical protein